MPSEKTCQSTKFMLCFT